MKDIYVYFTDHDYFREFRDHDKFKHPSEYDPIEYQNLQRNEYGKLRLNNFQMRLLFDNGFEPSCPWCNHPKPEVRQVNSKNIEYPFFMLFAECPHCLCRGPRLNISRHLSDNETEIEHYKDYVLNRWAQRQPKRWKINENK